MQTVSEEWKRVHEQTLLNESFVEVSLTIADPESVADATSQDNGAVYISDSTQVVSEVEKTVIPYCTLEQNMWLLDGSRQIIPEIEHEDSGYISDVLCDSECVFSTQMPVISVNFSKVFTKSIPGITITWSVANEEFADSFIVRVYQAGFIFAEKEVIGNTSVKSVVMMEIDDYDRIDILIKKWCLPNHRARVEKVLVGVDMVYSKTELFDYTHTQSVDPLSTSLPKAEIQFSISNVGGEYNPYNPQGMGKYLMERQEVKARYGLKRNDNTIEWIKGGTFYLSDWSAKQNGIVANFTARDLLEFMSDIYYDPKEQEGLRTLYDMAVDVLRSSRLPLNNDGTEKWVVDESLKSIQTFAKLPEDSRANCLQLIANMGMCVLHQDRTGTLHIEPLVLDNNYTDYVINSFNSYTKPEYSLSKPINNVVVKEYFHTHNVDGWRSEVTGQASAGGVDNTLGDEVIVVDNPVITEWEGEASKVGWWMYEHLRRRRGLDFSWRSDVRLDALDVITSPQEYNEERVLMTEIKFKYNGAFRGTGKGKVI